MTSLPGNQAKTRQSNRSRQDQTSTLDEPEIRSSSLGQFSAESAFKIKLIRCPIVPSDEYTDKTPRKLDFKSSIKVSAKRIIFSNTSTKRQTYYNTDESSDNTPLIGPAGNVTNFTSEATILGQSVTAASKAEEWQNLKRDV